MEKLKMHTQDVAEANIEKIGQLFPNCLTERINENGNLEMAIDFDKLKQELSKEVVEGNQERYQFTWPGKREAMRLANTPSNMTLRPDRESSVDFDDTDNLYIEGDNLEVLKLLRENYLGKVKMIYIDPPYNTGNDFVYEDDFSETTGQFKDKSGMFDVEGNMILDNYTVNTESNGRFHTDWLNMMYSRLRLAKDFLSEDGVIFMSIGEEELSNLISISSEIFGKSNYISTVSRIAKTASNMGNFFAASVDYIICFAKNINKTKPFKGDVDESLYKKVESSGPRKGEKYRDDIAFFQSGLKHGGSRYPITCPDGERVNTPDDKPWRASEETFLSWKEKGMIVFKETKTSPLINEDTGEHAHWNLYTKSYLTDRQDKGTQPRNILLDYINRKGADLIKTYDIPFDFAKPVELMEFLIKIINDNNCIIMDFFSGSSTTAHAVYNMNVNDGGHRKYIMIQVPEQTESNSAAYKSGFKNLCEIGKERIRRVSQRLAEQTPLIAQMNDLGFRVLKLDTSNMQDVYYKPEEFSETSLFEDNVKPDRSAEDLLFQVMLECNLPLSSKIKKKTIAGKEIFDVNDGYLLACFDQDVNETVIKEVAKQKPYYFIMRDSSLSSDNVADNFEQIFNAYSKDTIRKIL